MFALLAIAGATLPYERTTAQDSQRSPFHGTWTASALNAHIRLRVYGKTITATVLPTNGASAINAEGTLNGNVITFAVKSADGARTVTFQGTLTGSEIAFTRSVTIHNGGASGGDGVDGAAGPAAFTAVRAATGSLAGHVVDLTSGKGIGMAPVHLAAVSGDFSASTVTADDGAYAFNGVPTDGYVISIDMDHYLKQRNDQRIVGGVADPAEPIMIDPGQHLGAVDIRLAKKSAIAGTVVDRNGSPLANISMRAYVRLRRESDGWERLEAARTSDKLVWSGDVGTFREAQVTTDALGRYRLEDLDPGEYYVAAQPLNVVQPPLPPGMVRLLEENQKRAAALGIPGTLPVLATPPIGNAPAIGDPGPGEIYLTEFYPGETDPARSTPVHVPLGGEARGIDLTIRPTRTGTVTATVLPPDDVARSGTAAPLKIEVKLVASGLRISPRSAPVFGANESNEKFQFTGVSPGPYKLVAVSSRADRRLTAIEDVYVQPGASQAVALTLKNSVDIPGQISLDGPIPPGMKISQLSVGLSSVDEYIRMLFMESGRDYSAVNADGSFVLRDVIPDLRYEIRVVGSGSPVRSGAIRYGGSETRNRMITVRKETSKIEMQIGFQQ
jgi:hypothetical protein